MRKLFREIERAARVEAPIVIAGPTGSGKELVARALHALVMPPGPFCPVNVAAIPDGVVESELFGSGRGGFTGAENRAGLIESADGGLLFLDEAGDLKSPIQAKLLRVIENGEVRRVCTTATRIVRCRILLAVQEDPALLCSRGDWREDFFHRVAALILRVPPLTARRTDIPILANALVARGGLPPIAREAMTVLMSHSWPGNVRELQRVLVRAAFHSNGPRIQRSSIQSAIVTMASGTLTRPRSLADARTAHIRDTLATTGGNRQQAAERLGITPRHLYRLLQDG